jgi:ubiquitin C-terminal hydrolase
VKRSNKNTGDESIIDVDSVGMEADVSLGDIDLNMTSGTVDDSMVVDSEDHAASGGKDVNESTYSEIVPDNSFAGDTTRIDDINISTLAVNSTVFNAGSQSSDVIVDVRVSFIGFPEKNDEWVPLLSGKIRPINSRSGGKRGDLPIREEVLFVCSQKNVCNNVNLLHRCADSSTPGVNEPSSENGNSVAINRAGSLYSAYYVEVVNAFADNRGFEEALAYLQAHSTQDQSDSISNQSDHSAPGSQQSTPTHSQLSTLNTPTTTASSILATRSPFSLTSIVNSLEIAAAVGKTKVVLSQSFLQYYGANFIRTVSTLLRNISATEFRNITIEKIEASLLAVEGFSVYLYGRNVNASEYEYLWLDIALFILDCPYLNKRLGGLKLVSDLIRRCVNASESNGGLKSTITTTTTAGTDGASDSTEVAVSFRVVPVVYSITLKYICGRVLETHILYRLLRGDGAHYSLVARAGDIFKTLAKENMLPLDLISVAWEAGYVLHMSQAYQLLAETFTVIDPKLLLTFTKEYISEIDGSHVTTDVVDIVSAIGLRCRSVLMDIPNDSLLAANDDEDAHLRQYYPHIHLALQLHASAVSILWNWAGDFSGLSNSIATVCISRLEGLVALGAPLTTCVLRTNFPWRMQFRRTQDVIEVVVSALAGGVNVSSAVSVIQACVNAWPSKEDFKLNPNVVIPPAAGTDRIYTKADYALYLENSFAVIGLITNAVVTSRIKLLNNLGTLVPGYSLTPVDRSSGVYIPGHLCAFDDNRLFMSEQTKVNNAVLQNSRSTYKETLDSLLNFLHMFVRCCDSLVLPESCVSEIWNAIVMNPVTDAEVNAVMNFVSRVVIRNLPPKSPTVKFISDGDSSSSSSGGAAAETSGASSVANRRVNVCTVETVYSIFNNLLCSPKFIQSAFFTPSALDCIEKYFRWLNSIVSEAGDGSGSNSSPLIVERNDNSVPFVIVGKPGSLLGLEVFSNIVLSCSIDIVAANSVKFLTALPRRLSVALVEAGELTHIRSMLLDQCLALLQSLNMGTADRVKSERSLKRLLMLLDGLLEESGQDCYNSSSSKNTNYDRLRPHGVSGHGETLSLNITYSAKKQLNGPLLVQSTDTLGQLWDKIAVRAGKEPQLLKLFRLGKEIDADDRSKTLAQLKFGKSDTILVGEKTVAPGTKSPAPDSADTTSTAPDGLLAAANQALQAAARVATSEQRAASMPFSALPAVVLSHSRQNFNLFFELLNGCNGQLCDDLWELINGRLPTAPFVLKDWVELECDRVEDILLPEASAHTAHHAKHSLSFLLYSLQVIDILMQPGRNAEDLEKRKSEGTGLWAHANFDVKLIESWPLRFFAKGGIHALMKAFAWVAELLEHYCSEMKGSTRSITGDYNRIVMFGVTPALLLQSLDLLTVMLKAVCVRGGHTLFPGSVVHAVCLDLEKKPTTGGSGGNKNSRKKRAKHTAAKPVDAIKKESSLLGHEWGWRIVENTEFFADRFRAELDLAALQRFAVLLLTLLRPFSRCKLFSLDGIIGLLGSSVNERAKVLTNRGRLLAILHRLSVCWISSQSIQPDIIAELQSGSSAGARSDTDDEGKKFSRQLFGFDFSFMHLDVLLNYLLLGDIAHSSHKLLPSQLELETQLAESFELVLLCLINNADKAHTRLTLDDDSDTKPSSCSTHLKKQLFQSILRLRPQLIFDGSASAATAAQLSACYNNMFSLANKIFSNASGSGTIGAEQEGSADQVKETANVSSATDSTTAVCAIDSDSEEDTTGAATKATDSDDVVIFDSDDEDARAGGSGLGSSDGPDVSSVSAISCHDNAFLDNEYRCRISLEVYGELRAVFQTLTESSGAVTVIHIGGTLSLLASLIDGCAGALEALHAEGILNFIQLSALGLADNSETATKPENSSNQAEIPSKSSPILCTDDDSRYSAYSILRCFCSWDPDIAMRLFLSLSVLHNNLPPTNTFAYKPEKDAISSVGYVGIRNMGCTCYMNSLLQVLFTIPAIRNGILASTSKFQFNSNLNLNLNEEEVRDDILSQLKKIFLNLNFSEAKAFSPDDWVYAYKDDTGKQPINVMHQQDAQEFLQVLTDRLEQSLVKGEAATGTGTGTATAEVSGKFRQRDVLKKAFGGKLCNMMINTADEGYSSRVREQQEGFVCMSVDVKGCSAGLEQSLTRFVSGETISDFIWEENKPRVNITKHQCVSELSDTLIFHLKRFELNYDTLHREKVNDVFPFPKELSMRPYTREYLLSTMNGGQREGVEFREDDYYMYELRGVIVHTGTSDSGHYYSFIKVPDPHKSREAGGGERRWLEFNDSEVKEFPESQLDSECFGGATMMHEISSKASSSYSMENQKNAYMLVYSRIKPLEGSSGEQAADSVSAHLTHDPYSRQILAKISADNKKLRISQRVFAKPHLEFVVSLLQLLVDHDTQGLTQSSGGGVGGGNAVRHLSAQIVAESILFSSLLLSRCAYFELFKTMNNKIRFLLEQSQYVPKVPSTTPFPLLIFADSAGHEPEEYKHNAENIRWVSATELVLRRMVEVQWMEQVVMKNLILAPEANVRMQFAALLLALVAKAREIDGDEYDTYPKLKLQVGTMSAILNLSSTHTNFGNMTVAGHNQNNAMNVDSEEAELELAIRLSQSESTEVKNSAQSTFQSFITASVDDGSSNAGAWTQLSIRMLIELTMEWRLVLIAEHWRRADAYTWLVKELALLGSNVCYIMVLREVVWQFIDIFLGDSCPLFQENYPKGSRKRCPTSYVAVGPPLKSGQLPAAAKNIPDWSSLLETVNILVTSSYSYSMVKSNRNPPTLRDSRRVPRLETQSADLAVHKVFTSTILKQARYTVIMTDMFIHQSFCCEPYINECIACFFDSLTMASYDSFAHIFTLMERILLSKDDLTVRRAETWVSGPDGLVSVMTNLKNELSKNTDLHQNLCVLILSFVHLIQTVPAVRAEVQRPMSYTGWAPWMLKAMFQFKEKCAADMLQQQSNNSSTATSTGTDSGSDSNVAPVMGPVLPPDHQQAVGTGAGTEESPIAIDIDSAPSNSSSATANNSSGNAKPAPKGPYLVIYGETEAERELTWAARSERAFQLLRDVVNSFGGNADTLIPEDAFLPMVTVADDPELAAAKEASVLSATQFIDNSTGGGLGMMYDGMTDAEIAAYFQSQEDFGIE